MDTLPAARASWRGDGDLGMLARHLISAPFVYGLLLPIAVLDAAASGYQAYASVSGACPGSVVRST